MPRAAKFEKLKTRLKHPAPKQLSGLVSINLVESNP